MTYHSWRLSKPQIRMMKYDSLAGVIDYPQQEISDAYVEWVQKDEYSILDDLTDYHRIAVLQPKRGNRSYAKKHQKKLSQLLRDYSNFTYAESTSFVDPNDDHHGGSCVLFFTLNFNPNQISKAEAWDLTHNYKEGRYSAVHLFLSNLRNILERHYKEMGIDPEFINTPYFQVSQANLESHASGYPHFHVVVILDRMLPCVLHKGKKDPNKYTWRLDDLPLLNQIKTAWSRSVGHGCDSFCDLQMAVGDRIVDHEGNITSALAYGLKYAQKTVRMDKGKDILTHANLKFWNSRVIIGKKFLDRLGSFLVTKEKDPRHDSLTNELQTINEDLQRLNDQYYQITQEYGLFSDYLSGSERDFMESYPYAFFFTRLRKWEIQWELDLLKRWRYVGTVCFDNDPEAKTSFFSDLAERNRLIALVPQSLKKEFYEQLGDF